MFFLLYMCLLTYSQPQKQKIDPILEFTCFKTLLSKGDLRMLSNFWKPRRLLRTYDMPKQSIISHASGLVDYSLGYSDINSLSEKEWFHDSVLNAFFNLLDCKYRVIRQDYVILNIHIYHILIAQGYNFNNITRWTVHNFCQVVHVSLIQLRQRIWVRQKDYIFPDQFEQRPLDFVCDRLDTLSSSDDHHLWLQEGLLGYVVWTLPQPESFYIWCITNER